jgi:hypothetical protein
VPAGPLRPVAEWEALFLRSWDEEHRRVYLPASTSRNSWRFYELAYALDGLTAIFEATGERRYVDRALLYVENVVRSAAPSASLPASQYKDRWLGWAARDHPDDPSIAGGEYPLYESYCFRYVAKLLRAMRDHPTLLGDEGYRRRHAELLAFTRQHVWGKWMARGADAHVYRSNAHMASHWALLALELWALSDDPRERAELRAVVDNVNRHLPNAPSSLRQQLRPHPADPAAYVWSDRWGSDGAPPQDVSHGNGVIAYVVEAHRLGVEWTDADAARFVRTLREHVWRPGGGFAARVDGSGTGNGWISDGFAKLGRYDRSVQARLERYTIGRGMQLYGNGALNAKLLAERDAG